MTDVDPRRRIEDAVDRALIAAAGACAAMEDAAASLRAFGESADAGCDAAVDAMSAEERESYTALIECGTPRLNAICDAIDLTSPRE